MGTFVNFAAVGAFWIGLEPPSGASRRPSGHPPPPLRVSCSGGPLRRSRQGHRRPSPSDDREGTHLSPCATCSYPNIGNPYESLPGGIHHRCERELDISRRGPVFPHLSPTSDPPEMLPSTLSQRVPEVLEAERQPPHLPRHVDSSNHQLPRMPAASGTSNGFEKWDFRAPNGLILHGWPSPTHRAGATTSR